MNEINTTARKRIGTLRWVLTGILLGNTIGAGATLSVPDTPIFLANDVQANIFFALDDSGSMDWEVTLSNDALTEHPGRPNSGPLDMSPNDFTEDSEHCFGYNLSAYDPTVTYSPWVGVDEDGNAYVDQTIGAALQDPYDANGGTEDLLNADGTAFAVGYGIWVDGSGGNPVDGAYQDGECPTSDKDSGGYSVRAPDYTDARWIFVDTLTAAQQTNYANWYTYYRKREYVLKRAVSELIINSSQRMGLATLHNNNSVGTPVDDMTDATAKADLLDELFQINSSGGTPLRLLLENTGEYFDQTDSGTSLHSPLGFTDASPILPEADGGECQQNFTVLFSDGFWNGGAPSVGNTDEDGALEWDGGPHADTDSNTLADVAMKYYETDLSTSLDDEVPVITNIDENTAQHMVTYTVAFGLDGSLSATPADHEATTLPPPWPTPVSGTFTTIDDMRHAAFNGRGLYLAGQDPQDLIQKLNDVLTDIGNRTGSASAVAATSQSVQSDTLIFQGFFDTDGWDGDLFAIEFLDGGTIGATIWNASDGIPTENSRSIFTWVNDGTVDGDVFEWANLTAAQQTSIGAANIVDYIRGDQSNEVQNGGTFRNRTELLGDIVHSAPRAVTKKQATPPYQLLPGTEGTSFNAFLASKATRQDMVYVGANDGMLHAFRTTDGVEEFAYVPSGTFPNLADLTSTSYGHKFYVDGPLQAADAYVSSNWKSVLIGALGRGGNGLFALDVSTPTTFDRNDVMWEYDDTEMGRIIGKPQIVRLNNGVWAVVTGNGYNSTSERAQLYVINLATGALIKKFDTGAGSAASSNGLSAPLVVDINSDFKGDYVYAGDLLGNMWKFDLTDSDPNNWATSYSGNALYSAIAPSGNAQPITTKPSIIVHPDGGYLILFGTGRFFVAGDDIVTSPAEVETFYGIWDNNASVTSVGARALPGSTQPSTVLQPNEITSETVEDFDGNMVEVRGLTENTVDYTTQKGWYIDFVSPTNGAEGERMISDPVVAVTEYNDPLVLFNTFAPDGGCETAGGFSFIMAFDPVNGAKTPFAVFDLNGDGSFNSSDGQDDGNGGTTHYNGKRTNVTVSTGGMIASQDGTVNYNVNSGLDGSTSVNAINGAAQSLGRQAWRQLK